MSSRGWWVGYGMCKSDGVQLAPAADFAVCLAKLVVTVE